MMGQFDRKEIDVQRSAECRMMNEEWQIDVFYQFKNEGLNRNFALRQEIVTKG